VPLTRRPLSEAHCPITRAVDVLADRWTLLILKNANVGMTRFDEFSADLGIADNILSTRLNRLVELGLMVKSPYQAGRRTRFEYKLTTAGADVLPILHTLADWGHKHTTIAGVQAVPITFLHVDCGTPMEAGEYCPRCEVRVPRQREVWVRPWRDPVVAPMADPVEDASSQVVFSEQGSRTA
jgi:DNA-binding HxlR family transcriptional regulator